VFGSAIGSRIEQIGGVSYGAFIVPGLIMMSLLTLSSPTPPSASISRNSPAPSTRSCRRRSPIIEIVLAYVGAAATKSIMIGLVILATAAFFVPICASSIRSWMLLFLVLTAVTFSLFGFIIGIWADGFEKLQIIPLLVVMPLAFLGGTFYSIDMLPPSGRRSRWQPGGLSVSGFRWSFFGTSDVNIGISLGMTLFFLVACLAIVAWIFRTGYKLKT
jgi:ABC-2 type transport system permease protein